MEDGLFIKGGHQPGWTKSIKAHKKNTVVVEAKPGENRRHSSRAILLFGRFTDMYSRSDFIARIHA